MVKKIFEYPGKEIGFKFSMLAKGRAEVISGLPLSQLFAGMIEVKEVDGKKLFYENHNTVMYTLYFLYGGACAYAISKGKKEPTLDEVSDFLEEIGQEAITEAYTEGLKSYFPKNAAPPETTGETIGQ